MLLETLRIKSLHVEYLTLDSEALKSCQGCASKPLCGQSLWAKLFGVKPVDLQLEYPQKGCFYKGQLVTIGIEEFALLRASILTFLIPLCGLFLGVILGGALQTEEVFGIVLALAGLVLGFLISRFFHNFYKLNKQLNPVIVNMHENQ